LYLINAGKLQEQPDPGSQPLALHGESGEKWFEVQDANPEELTEFLTPLNLHPLQMKRCLDSIDDPGVISFEKSILMEYPAEFSRESMNPAYLTILLKDSVLVTIRHGAMPALDDLVHSLIAEPAPSLLHLSQLIYMILDQFSDLNVEAQIEIRDQILRLSNTLNENPDLVSIGDLSHLRAQVGNMLSLVENQLYCISGLNACDNEALQDPHRKAYIQDLQSEMEIAQRGIYHLESRVKDLFSDFQAAGSERVEKRLRLLTIISAIVLPLGLIAGLLGMNVGGLPGTSNPSGFIIVSVLMILIVVAEYLYFKRKGWFN
jgi:Mg2+ and Co2+ transporter CorA